MVNNSKEKLYDLTNTLITLLLRKYNVPQSAIAPIARVIKQSIDNMSENEAEEIIMTIKEVIK
jgi:hypothetical protein